MNIEAIRDNEAASAEAAVRRADEIDRRHWLGLKVVCDSNGPLKPEHVETVLKLCDSIRPTS